DQLLLDPLPGRVAEERAQDRQVAQAGEPDGRPVERELDEPGDGQRLALAELDGRLRLPRIQAGDRVAAGHERDGDGEVDLADLGRDGEPDDIAVEDVGDEPEPDAEL